MMNLLFRLFLTFNATSLILVVYWIKTQAAVSLNHYSLLFSCIIGSLIPFFFTLISLLLSNRLSDDSIETKDHKPVIKEVEPAHNNYLPVYLGYFFVALSIDHLTTLLFVFLLLFLFTFLSQTLYFNPLFLLFGYHFYYLTTANNIKIFVITKRKNLKDPTTITFSKLKRINDFTFIDNEK